MGLTEQELNAKVLAALKANLDVLGTQDLRCKK